MLYPIYRGATRALTPVVLLYLSQRCRRGKEDPLRLAERRGIAGRPRPLGPLVWLHAASVGEAMTVLGLIEAMLDTRPGLEILLTTGTLASARLLGERLPPRARHQFAPVDLPGAVDRFLDHWRPDLALWVESELWPNLVLTTRARGVPMALLNGRLSARSYAGWRRWPGLIGPMLAGFAPCLGQDARQAERLNRLGAHGAASVGDLKAGAAPLPVDEAALAALNRAIGLRPRWLAASTHEGEEAIAAEAHRVLATRHAGLLTLIAPRHPGRSPALVAMLEARGLRVARRTLGALPGADTDIYLADTMGELGLFYRLSGIALIGGSLVAKGGHNPFEAARLDCAVLLGPDVGNCAAMAAALIEAGAAETVADAAALAEAVSRLIAKPPLRAERAAAGAQVAASGLGVVEAVLDRLAPLLDRLAPTAPAERSASLRA